MKGVYEIINKLNGKKYIGSSVNIKHRWVVHKSKLRKHQHENFHLQNAWNKYGSRFFEFKVIELVDGGRSKLLSKEQKYINDHGPEYNIVNDASEGGVGDYWLGREHSEETKQKMSKKHKGENAPGAKLNAEQVKRIKQLLVSGNFTKHEMAQKYNVHPSTIKRIVHDETWDHIEVEGEPKLKKSPDNRKVLNENQVSEIKEKLKQGNFTQKEIAKEYDCSSKAISDINIGRTWSHVN